MAGTVLCLRDVCLREADVALLRDPCSWLTDQIIAYVIEKLNDGSGDGASDGGGFRRPELFDASCSMLLLYAPEVVMDARPAAVDAPASVFVVNNNDDPNRAFGGTHWSVLVYERRTREFYALDSIRGANDAAAEALASSLAPLLLGSDDPRPPVVRRHPMLPSQCNAHDCGVYTCLFLEETAGWFSSGDGDARAFAAVDFRSKITEGRVGAYKEKLLRMIDADVRRHGR